MTKRELAAQALALGKRLGVEVDVLRKNRQALTELVEDLRRRAQSGGPEEPGQAQGGEDGGAQQGLDGAASTTIAISPPTDDKQVVNSTAGIVRRPTGPRDTPRRFSIEELQTGETIKAHSELAPPRGQLLGIVRPTAPAPAPPAAEVRSPGTDGSPAPKGTPYRVAPGKVLTTQRGYLKAGDVVAASDLAGGQGTIELLVAKAVIENATSLPRVTKPVTKARDEHDEDDEPSSPTQVPRRGERPKR